MDCATIGNMKEGDRFTLSASKTYDNDWQITSSIMRDDIQNGTGHYLLSQFQATNVRTDGTLGKRTRWFAVSPKGVETSKF